MKKAAPPKKPAQPSKAQAKPTGTGKAAPSKKPAQPSKKEEKKVEQDPKVVE